MSEPKLLLDTKGGCAICGKPPAMRLVVDHERQSAAVVRRLLCERCNRLAGASS